MTPKEVEEYFDRVLQARADLIHLRHRVVQLESTSLPSGIAQAVQSGISDPTSTAGSILADTLKELEELRKSYLSTISRAKRIVSSVRRGVGLIEGDILEDYYLLGLTWDNVSRRNQLSRATIIRYRDIAFDAIATVGLARAEVGDWELIHA